MTQGDDNPEEFVLQLGRQISRYDTELERTERMQGILAVGMLKIERLAQALHAEVEQMKSQMAGITPQGFEPLPPK
jgi:hypothetical protein